MAHILTTTVNPELIADAHDEGTVNPDAIISNAAYDDMRQLLNRRKNRQTYPCNLLLFCR